MVHVIDLELLLSFVNSTHCQSRSPRLLLPFLLLQGCPIPLVSCELGLLPFLATLPPPPFPASTTLANLFEVASFGIQRFSSNFNFLNQP